MIEEPQNPTPSRRRNMPLQYQFINRCRGCQANADALDEVLTMSPMPLAGLFCDTQEEARKAPRFPLSWLYCCRCGLVQVGEDVADCDLFEKYHYASSSVPTLVRHFEDYATALIAQYGESSTIRLLEIGCNDGVLLRKLPTSWTLAGADPSDVAENPSELDNLSGTFDGDLSDLKSEILKLLEDRFPEIDFLENQICWIVCVF